MTTTIRQWLSLEMLDDEPRVQTSPTSRQAAQTWRKRYILSCVWILTDAYREIRYKFLKEAKERFDANGISIPFDQLDVHIS